MFKKIGGLKVVLIAVVALLIISNVATAFYFYQKDKKEKKEITALEEFSKNKEEEQTKPVKLEDVEIRTDNTKGSITVEWNEWPIETDWNRIFSRLKVEEIVDGYNTNNSSPTSVKEIINTLNAYHVGTVQAGEYQGDGVYIIMYDSPPDTMPYSVMHRIVKHGNENILLTNHSEGTLWGVYERLFIENDKISIANLETLNSIDIPNSDIKLIKKDSEPFTFISNYQVEKLFEYEQGRFVYKGGGCYIARADDGTVREYYFDLKFLQGKEDNYHLWSLSPNLVNITWFNGKQNIDDYNYQEYGTCGQSRGCYIYLNNDDINTLTLSGKTSTGDNVYEADRDNKNLKDLYDSYYAKDDKESYDEFLELHPMFYWQNPFGSYIGFKKAKYMPVVECGKPVIYLYPEQEQDISVWVNPTGGFKITEPEYNNGWKVKAKPNGEIYNYDDEKIYPYLFWEGYGLDYERPEQGFVVAKTDVEEFLNKKLIELGLIKKEADEFIEFWLPRMQEKNYYFITFVPQTEFDKLAPLVVSPKPDTVIRVFMDYEGLNEYKEVTEQKIITPERNGFVVAEWGGTIHR